jgi:hypothetical protein
MRKTLSVALAVAALGLGAGGAALADPAAPMAASTAPASGVGVPSVDWTVGDLMANPGTRAVMIQDLPGIQDDPRVDTVKILTLRAVAQYPEAQIDQAKLDTIQADLSKLKPAS